MRFTYSLKYYFVTLTATVALTSAAPQSKVDTTDPSDIFQEGLRAFNRYDLKQAKALLTKYKDRMNKAKLEPAPEADEALAAIPLAQDMLAGRVEHIVIIDSVQTRKASALDTYKISGQSGRIFEPDDLHDMGESWKDMTPFGTSFENEDGSVRYICVSEEIEETDGDVVSVSVRPRIYEGFELADGTWSEPIAIFEEDVEAAYPFMLPDGCTFYFSSKSEAGLGGYDIFRSYRDSDTGEFQNPVNMGLPYNSPSDDFMLAIDEYNGIGLWTTDRAAEMSNSGDELSTTYFFIPSDVRNNYDADTPNIEALAALWTLHFPGELELPDEEDDELTMQHIAHTPGWKLTWPTGEDYTELRKKIIPDADNYVEEDEFLFAADGGKLYTRYSQLPMKARAPMQRYLEAEESLSQTEKLLSQLRQEYRAKSSESVRKNIRQTQKRVEGLRSDVKRRRGELYSALRNSK